VKVLDANDGLSKDEQESDKHNEQGDSQSGWEVPHGQRDSLRRARTTTWQILRN